MKISIVGAGSFGTSLAKVISENNCSVNLFARNKEVIDCINNKRVNKNYFPSVVLNKNIQCINILEDSAELAGSDFIFFALPSGVTREVVEAVNVNINNIPILSTSKGIEFPSLLTMSEVIKEVTGNRRVYSFSGPTFADEIMNGSFTSATIGIDHDEDLEVLKKVLDLPNLIFDYTNDISGVELCGVLKNIYSIAAGIFDSFSNSNNEHHAFLNLCFKEMHSILSEYSVDKDLILRFCAFGDFSMTTNSDKSRNRTLGLMVGKGMLNLNEFNPSIIFEGLKSINAIEKKCENKNIKVPIVSFVKESLDDIEGVKLKLNKLLQEF